MSAQSKADGVAGSSSSKANASNVRAKTIPGDDEVQFLGVKTRKLSKGPIKLMAPFPWTKGKPVKQIYCTRHGWAEPRLPGPEPAYYTPGAYHRQWLPVYGPKAAPGEENYQEAVANKKRRTADGGCSSGQTSNATASGPPPPSEDSNDSTSSLCIPDGEIQPQDFLRVRFIKEEITDEDDNKDDDQTNSVIKVELWNNMVCAKHGDHKIFIRAPLPTDIPHVPVLNPIQKFLGSAFTPTRTKIFKFQFFAYVARHVPCMECQTDAYIEIRKDRHFIVRKRKVLAYLGCTRYCPRSRAVVMMRELRQVIPQNVGLSIRMFEETLTKPESEAESDQPSSSDTVQTGPPGQSFCVMRDASKDAFWGGEEGSGPVVLADYLKTEICCPCVCGPPWNSDPASEAALRKSKLNAKEVQAYAQSIFLTLAKANPSRYDESDYKAFGLRKPGDDNEPDTNSSSSPASPASVASSASSASSASTSQEEEEEEEDEFDTASTVHDWSDAENDLSDCDYSVVKTEKEEESSEQNQPEGGDMTF